MIVLGITGGTGGGKTTLLRRAAALGALALDCDAVYHRLLAEDAALRRAIEARFPALGNAWERKDLGKIVFRDPQALRDLNALTHPAVCAEVRRRLRAAEAAGTALAAVDAVALWESGLGDLCQVTVAVTAPAARRVRRLMAREGVPEDYARLRIAAQRPDSWYAARCDVRLENDYPDEQTFAEACDRLLLRITGGNDTMSELDSKQLRETLFLSRKNGYDGLSAADEAAMGAYCADYMAFLAAAKTEREAVDRTAAEAEKAGFRPYAAGMALRPGDKIYEINRGKSVLLAVIGEKPLEQGVRLTAAHIDSPRLDLKPNPLYEEQELALLKTHYYGGIKKYQWTTVPLALHGVLALTDGSVLKVSVGEDPADPVFCVTDLLVHLSAEQMKKSLAEGVTGEQLNVLLGSRPFPGGEDERDRVKLAALALLHEKYGIVEEDLVSAELTMVPALPVREVGLDRSMIGGYGHDDRVCAYAGLYPLLSMGSAPAHTAVCLLADKEEIGSEGVTGAQSQALELFLDGLCAAQGGDLRRCLAASVCFAVDVAAAYDPSFADVYERRNSALLNHGVAVCKYTGSRGKGGASDAAAELVARFRRAFRNGGVCWQMSELGRVDAGGGGTVAKYIANRNVDTLDAGVPVLSMHAPWEIVGKLDCYMTMKACGVFYRMD